MPMDDRKERIMMAIVSLYASDGEPVGSNLLQRRIDISVSSATLRNEMAALTRLGLLEQPHTSAGRIPTAKGYRYYVDHLLRVKNHLTPKEEQCIQNSVATLDHDPEKLARGSAMALSDLLGYAVIATTPLVTDSHIVHYEVMQVGRYTMAVLAVTVAGGVLTRVAKVDFEPQAKDCQRLAQALNKHLCFVAEADVGPSCICAMVNSLGEHGPCSWPILSAALVLLAEAGKSFMYFEGQKHLLRWTELDKGMRALLELVGTQSDVEHLLRPQNNRTTVLLGDEMERPIPGLCIVSRHYPAAGGLYGALAVLGPTRMQFGKVIPTLEYFSRLLGNVVDGNSNAQNIFKT